MKIRIVAAILCLLFLNSCALVRTLIQVPVRTLQSVGRTVGMGIEKTENSDQQEIQFRHSRDLSKEADPAAGPSDRKRQDRHLD